MLAISAAFERVAMLRAGEPAPGLRRRGPARKRAAEPSGDGRAEAGEHVPAHGGIVALLVR